MRRLGLLFVIAHISCSLALAQRISHVYNDVSLSDALLQLQSEQSTYTINFLYNELEDFRITTTVTRRTLPDAIQQMIGFYPVRMTVKPDDHEIYVECTHKTDRHLTGTIVDEQGKPVAYANIALLSPQDSTLLSGGVSNEGGYFSIPYEQPQVLARVSYVGYQTIYKLFSSEQAGTIRMQPDNYMIEGVVVKGYTPAYRLTIEGIQTNVEGSVLSKLGTGEDVLVHVPGIAKKEGRLEVFGKGVPLIYINGRQMRDASELDLLKSENIKSVELITNPGAKYDASIKAVVKIRTKPTQGEGFGLDVRSSYCQSENTDLTEQVDWNYRHNRLDVFGTIHYKLNQALTYPSTVTTVQADTLWEQKFDYENIAKKQTLQNTLGTNYTFSDESSAGFRYTLNLHYNDHQTAWLTSDIVANGVYFDHVDNTLFTTTTYRPEHLLNAYYHGIIGKVGIDFNADYLYHSHHEHSVCNEQSENSENRIVTAKDNVRNELFATKFIANYHLSENSLTIGAEYTLTHRNDNYINPEQYVPTSYAKLKEAHAAVFIEYARQLLFGRLTTGLRYEWVDFEYYENGTRLDAQSRSFGNLFPNLSFGTQVGKIQVQLGYTAKIRRPTYHQLSNNVTYGNRFLLQTGNPLLNHERIHDLSLMGVWKFLQFYIGYNTRHNAIIDNWAEQQAGNTAVTRFTHLNIPMLKSLSAQIAIAPKFGIWSPELSIGMQKQWLTLHTDNNTYRMNSPIFQFNLANTFNFSYGWTMSVNGNLTNKGHNENYYLVRNSGIVNVSLVKSMLNDRLSICLQGNDLFHTEKRKVLMYANMIQTKQTNCYDSREFVLTLRYKFNTTRSKYRGTGAGNDEKSRL